MKYDFADGKYTVINTDGTLTALRNGEPWDRDLIGDNLVYWMLVKVNEQADRIDQLEWENKGIEEWRDEYLRVKAELDSSKTRVANAGTPPRNIDNDTISKLHGVVRKTLKFHKLTEVGDAVVESDLIYGMLGVLSYTQLKRLDV